MDDLLGENRELILNRYQGKESAAPAAEAPKAKRAAKKK